MQESVRPAACPFCGSVVSSWVLEYLIIIILLCVINTFKDSVKV